MLMSSGIETQGRALETLPLSYLSGVPFGVCVRCNMLCKGRIPVPVLLRPVSNNGLSDFHHIAQGSHFVKWLAPPGPPLPDSYDT